VSTAADIVKMIMDRTSHTGGAIHLSESLDNVGLDSMEVVSLIFDLKKNSIYRSRSMRIWILKARPWPISFNRLISLLPLK
jgi:hypothetical protein